MEKLASWVKTMELVGSFPDLPPAREMAEDSSDHDRSSAALVNAHLSAVINKQLQNPAENGRVPVRRFLACVCVQGERAPTPSPDANALLLAMVLPTSVTFTLSEALIPPP